MVRHTLWISKSPEIQEEQKPEVKQGTKTGFDIGPDRSQVEKGREEGFFNLAKEPKPYFLILPIHCLVIPKTNYCYYLLLKIKQI